MSHRPIEAMCLTSQNFLSPNISEYKLVPKSPSRVNRTIKDDGTGI